ncbi:VOC family protein [Actinokineospora iranica]|uniref:VOC domain-containing protein n=1 Tax=Actinokineospora iranica TaxID=1271860 RepID=A0A1G6LTX9_9PSEU|nr:VOC family protein [Actinokineospora iranica]SDC46703.1 hypothetical protein SAMN05216174_102240 [Actinokineospora iranica]
MTASLMMVNIDCDDPQGLAAFYSELLGWKITYNEGDYAMITGEGTSIGFGRIEGYAPPRWPDEGAPKRFHLDLYVDDFDQAEARGVELGATKPDFQPGEGNWRVMLDPSGQPFCLCRRPS